MADEMKPCVVCCTDTKYVCIKCKKPICNVCGTPERDEDTDGWIYGKQVSYCYSCKRKSDLLKRRTKSIIAGAALTDKLRDARYGYVVHIMIYVYAFIYGFRTVAYKNPGPWAMAKSGDRDVRYIYIYIYSQLLTTLTTHYAH